MPRLFTDGLLSADAASVLLSVVPLLLIAFVACTPLIRKGYDRLSGKKLFPVLQTAAVAAVLLLCTASLVSDAYNPFLYFKF